MENLGSIPFNGKRVMEFHLANGSPPTNIKEELDLDSREDVHFHAYNPSAPLVPWHIKSKENDNVEAQQEKDITLWKHNIKPTFSAFPEFKDDSFYSRFKQEAS